MVPSRNLILRLARVVPVLGSVLLLCVCDAMKILIISLSILTVILAFIYALWPHKRWIAITAWLIWGLNWFLYYGVPR